MRGPLLLPGLAIVFALCHVVDAQHGKYIKKKKKTLSMRSRVG
jgi:hypothetical protein